MLKRKISEKDFSDVEIVDLTNIFAETECSFLKGKPVFGIKLHKMKGLLGKQIMKGRSFGKELATYVTAVTGLKGIIHSDEQPHPKIKISEREIEYVKTKLKKISNIPETKLKLFD